MWYTGPVGVSLYKQEVSVMVVGSFSRLPAWPATLPRRYQFHVAFRPKCGGA